MRSVSCPACEVKTADLLFEQEVPGLVKARLVRCRGCGMGYLDPQPDPGEIAPYYEKEYYGGSGAKFVASVERLRARVARRRARRLAGGLPPGARVLDVGCGDGRLLAAFAALGYRAVGTERAGRYPRGLSSLSGVEIRPGDLTEAALGEGQFDLCIYWHVLEHLHDPRATLARARGVLKPGGRLVIAVPNLDSLQARWSGPAWFHLDIPRHLYHFTPKSLAKLLLRSGFNLQSVGHYAIEQNPFGILQSVLNRWSGRGISDNRLYEYLKGNSEEISAPRRFGFRAVYWAGMPVALFLSALESMIGRGGTIEAWAIREPR